MPLIEGVIEVVIEEVFEVIEGEVLVVGAILGVDVM